VSVRSLLVKVSLLVPLMAVSAWAVAPKHPAVVEWQGSVWITGKDGKRLSLRGKQVLREKAVLETGANSRVKIQLDPVRQFTVGESSEVSIPVISWESGEAPVVLLKKGEIHWLQSLKEKAPYNVALRSDLFEFIAPAGDYVLSIDPAKAFARVKMFEGSMEFSAMNGEESVTVKSGQQAAFQGVIEGGEIAYDVLLKGKKIPKGQLTAVTAIDAKELNAIAATEKKRLKDVARKHAQEKAEAVKFKKAGYICAGPPAKFNECAWVCKDNPKSEKKACAVAKGASCERMRCNANGDWAESTVLDAEKASSICKSQPVVGPCDY